MAKFRCSQCDLIIGSLADLKDIAHENREAGEGYWVKLPEVTRINPAEFFPTSFLGIAGKIDQALEQLGFVWMGEAPDGYFSPDELIAYRDWAIALDVPNGGTLGVDLIHEAGWWGRETATEFGYYQDSEVIGFAKQTIDEVERYLAEVPGQLSLFEVQS
ncbi:MAG TPA: hypothetical protein V6C63_06815 [Allocoleopsis sp.]